MRSRPSNTSLLLAVVVTLAGVVWEISALNSFANRAGEMNGMIANPRPYDYINYDYTPDGHRIAFWAITLPVSATSTILLLIGVVTTIRLMRTGEGKRAFVFWCWIAMCLAVLLAVTARYYLIATNFFI